MKRFYFHSGILLTLFFFATPSSALKAQTALYEELIVQVPSFDEGRTVPQIQADLIALGGIQFVDYCNSFKCMMLKIDRSIHPSNQAVQAMFETKLIPYYIKEEVSISQMILNCKDPIPVVSEDK